MPLIKIEEHFMKKNNQYFARSNHRVQAEMASCCMLLFMWHKYGDILCEYDKTCYDYKVICPMCRNNHLKSAKEMNQLFTMHNVEESNVKCYHKKCYTANDVHKDNSFLNKDCLYHQLLVFFVESLMKCHLCEKNLVKRKKRNSPIFYLKQLKKTYFKKEKLNMKILWYD